MVQIDTDPKKLANWLQITKAQRERAAKQLVAQLGADSQGATEMQAEAAEIGSVISACLKLATETPKRK